MHIGCVESAYIRLELLIILFLFEYQNHGIGCDTQNDGCLLILVHNASILYVEASIYLLLHLDVDHKPNPSSIRTYF